MRQSDSDFNLGSLITGDVKSFTCELIKAINLDS